MTTPEEIITCPYNKAHSIILNRMQFHLARCRVQHPHAEKTICPFNSTHVVNKVELEIHQRICDNRIVLDSFKYKVGESSKTRLTTNVDENVKFDESWDDELLTESVLENVKKDSLNKPAFTVLIGAAKGERKAHRFYERLRIRRVMDGNVSLINHHRRTNEEKNKIIEKKKGNNSCQGVPYNKEENRNKNTPINEHTNHSDCTLDKERNDVKKEENLGVDKSLPSPRTPKNQKEKEVFSYATVTSGNTSTDNIPLSLLEKKQENLKEDKSKGSLDRKQVASLQYSKAHEDETSSYKPCENLKEDKRKGSSGRKQVASLQYSKAPEDDNSSNKPSIARSQRNADLIKNCRNSLEILKIDSSTKRDVSPKLLNNSKNNSGRNILSPWKIINKCPSPHICEEDDFPALPAIGRARGRRL